MKMMMTMTCCHSGLRSNVLMSSCSMEVGVVAAAAAASRLASLPPSKEWNWPVAIALDRHRTVPKLPEGAAGQRHQMTTMAAVGPASSFSECGAAAAAAVAGGSFFKWLRFSRTGLQAKWDNPTDSAHGYPRIPWRWRGSLFQSYSSFPTQNTPFSVILTKKSQSPTRGRKN